MLGIPDLEAGGGVLVSPSAKGDGFGREVNTSGCGPEALGEEGHCASTPASDIQHPAALQLGVTDQLKGQPDGAGVENAVRHCKAGFVAIAQANVAIVEEEGSF